MATYANEDEVVYDVSEAKTDEEMEKLLKHNERAKILRAERREQERLNEPGLISKFKNGIKKLFGLNQAKKKQIEQSQQNSR